MKPTGNDVVRILAWPVALAAASLLGLITALVGGQAWAPASWVALGLPVAVIAWRAFGASKAAGPARNL